MESKVFIDASAFVALYNSGDSCHEPAVRISRKILKDDKVLTTSFEVILETATVLRRMAGLTLAKKFLARVRDGSFLLLAVDEAVRSAAVSLFLSRRTPKDLSLFDCLYVSLMRTYEVGEAFSFDRHFKKLGVVLLLA